MIALRRLRERILFEAATGRIFNHADDGEPIIMLTSTI
jgi:hypothetical protein